MLDTIFDTLYLDFNSFSDFGGSISRLGSALFNDGNFASDWASIQTVAETAMKEFSDNWTGKN